MPTLEQTTQEVLNLAVTHFKLAPGTLAPEDDFFKKLGIDSLQTLELLSRIENHFNIELPDYEVIVDAGVNTLALRTQSRLYQARFAKQSQSAQGRPSHITR